MSPLPNLLVIGAMKCGTSSLHHYLGLHPEIGMSAEKELNYLLPPQPSPPAGTGAADLALLRETSTAHRGRDWYEARFPDVAVRGETSVAYSFPWYAGVAERAAWLSPTEPMRIIYLVREPIARIASHRAQFAGRDPRPAAEALRAPGNPYVEASRYATAVAPFIEALGRESVLILDQADLRHRRETTLERVFGFLGVATSIPPGTDVERNVTAAKGRLYRRAEALRAGPAGRRIARLLPRGLRGRAEGALTRNRDGRGGPAGLDAALVTELRARLAGEVEGIERLTGWDRSAWR